MKLDMQTKLKKIYGVRHSKLHMRHCAIHCHLYNLKNAKNIHRGVLLLVKYRLKPATLLKVTLLHGCFLRFANCKDGTKSRKASHMNMLCSCSLGRVPTAIFKENRSFIKISVLRMADREI